MYCFDLLLQTWVVVAVEGGGVDSINCSVSANGYLEPTLHSFHKYCPFLSFFFHGRDLSNPLSLTLWGVAHPAPVRLQVPTPCLIRTTCLDRLSIKLYRFLPKGKVCPPPSPCPAVPLVPLC